MTDDTRLNWHGETADEWIDSLPLLDDEPVNMWVIVPTGRHYGLEGDALIEFVRRAIRKLLDVGSKPVKRDPLGPFYWAVQTRFGETTDEIVENVINEWVDWGAGDPSFNALWFASPSDCAIRNLPMDEWFSELPLQLEKGPFAVSTIAMHGGYDYQLDGDSLAQFIARGVRLLLDKEAVLERIESTEPYDLKPTTQFGDDAETIVSNIVAAWRADGDHALDGLYLAAR